MAGIGEKLARFKLVNASSLSVSSVINQSTSTEEPMTLPVLKLRLKRNWPLFLQPPLTLSVPELDLT